MLLKLEALATLLLSLHSGKILKNVSLQVEKQRELRDAESRVAAVKALADVTVKLLSSQASTKQRREVLPSRTDVSLPQKGDGLADMDDVRNSEQSAVISALELRNKVKTDGTGSGGPEVYDNRVSGVAPREVGAAMLKTVVDALMHAMQDYSIDSRFTILSLLSWSHDSTTFKGMTQVA